MAPLVRYGLWGTGVSVFLDQVGPLLSDGQFTWGERRIMGLVALLTIGGFGLGGWVAGRLMKASAELIDLLIDAADSAWRTADLIELRMIPTLGRIANALEKSEPAPQVHPSESRLTAIRGAIADCRWEEAEGLIEALARDRQAASEASALGDELGRARDRVIETHRQELEAARVANDPDRVIDARDALTLHLRGERLVELDRQLVRWLVTLLQGWVRSGRRAQDVALLASRLVDTFGDTAEAASLRASLANLRRKAGLCPRCARPFQGSAESCPRCVVQRPTDAPLFPAGA
ncbi:hypothetical protein SAMN05444166_6885 [Singulisphaera sp. GP187]|nr:hypothetical protein SAMN05444166_6885 [Singulisphaera sp. GP187]